ncbi:hypothetical protein B0T22DRAFT_104550 [Podospora appendiculata]|uniref:DNA repair protein REV1 n=1 Tax=Podospora appendiculata TaxID=314037 RepID=A0AAE0XL61_9PEZI|nr:hypothetical protein B0T22DRAFT_104550 [Podospora appendiculata]
MGSRLEKNSAAVRKRIEDHSFADEAGDEYEGSEFGGFGDYFRRKKIKLQNLDVELRAAAGDKPQIFKGVVAHVSGYTQPPLAILHKELVQHGAGFLQYLDAKTMATHIIASAMPPKKAIDFTKYRVVKPAWVTDSVEAGRLLPWTDYRVIDDGPRQKTIKFDGGKMFSQSAQQSPRGYREQTEKSFYTSQFQKSTGPLSSREGSSPFQPRSATKPTIPTVEGIEDDVDDDMEVDLLVERSAVVEQGTSLESRTIRIADKAASSIAAEFVIPPLPEKSKAPEDPSKTKTTLTSEEHNAILLSDPHIRKSSTANPDFLKQYYSESRLHHLSTWKAQLKSRMQSLAAENCMPLKMIKPRSSRRYILHVDFDSFFCAVSLKHAPEFIDKPAVVAHGNGSGSEIASCNYPARKFGLKNGMWMKRALELCPDLKVLPYDFPGYEEASRQFYDAILEVGGIVQSVSIDEALVDVTDIVLSETGSEGAAGSEEDISMEQKKVDEIALNLRTQVKTKTGCHVSVGIGGNVLLAKTALRKAKPAGQYQIKPDEVFEILGELRVGDLPGVAYSIGGRLEEIGIKLVKDIRQTSKERLISLLGPKTGEKLWEYGRGIDRTEVGEQPIRKSVSADVNWGIRFTNQEEAEQFVRSLSKELERRLLSEGVKGKHLTMKIMKRALDAPLDPPKHLGHGKCDTFNKSVTFGVATNSGELLGKEAVTILRSYKFNPGDLRGLGLQMTKLEPLKPSTTAAPDGSQKKLSFGAFAVAGTSSTKRQNPEQIDDDGSLESVLPDQDVEQDPISIDPLTPRKPKVHPAMAISKANAADEKARTPLNLGGTQFIIPSHPDPAVLAELPQDIRSKLLTQARRASAAQSREPSPFVASRSQNPALAEDVPSDIDPEVFNALPEDMQAEVLASYGARKRQQGRSIRPQSPTKDRIIHRAREKVMPTKRGMKTLFGRASERERQQDAETRASEANIRAAAGGAVQNHGDGIEGLDMEFLAELPEDVRREIIEDHRRRRLAQRPDDADDVRTLPGGQTTLKFPARPPKVVFAKGVSSLKEVKGTVLTWYNVSQKKGPHREDVEVFEKYLANVILEERDMEKVRMLMKWLAWTVEDMADGDGKLGWRKALVDIKKAVQQAMGSRGLGPMDFG